MGKLLYTDSRRLSSPLARRELLEQLDLLIGPPPRPFLGHIDGGDFKIQRIDIYRSTFLPFLRGTVRDAATGSEIVLRFRPHRQVLIFLAVWYLFLLLAAGLIVLLGEGARRLLLLVPLGLGGATWVLSALVFESDCRWVVRSFEDALRGENGGKQEPS